MEPPKYFIRKANNDDVAPLAQLAIATFYDTYAWYNTMANMQDYVSKNYTHEALSLDLAAPETFYYIAFDGTDMVGYIKMRNTEHPPVIQHLPHIEVERIYVLPAYKGKGIGRLLLDTACTHAKQNAYAILWLGVWENNEKAFRFYERYGFKKFGDHVFMLGDDKQTDWLLKIEV